MKRFLPRKSDFEFRSWREDLLAGVAVGVVALPLALAFGITTGLSAGAGLVTAIVAGFLAALFGGSRFQVSGPTGAMTVVLVPIVTQYGASAVPFVGLLAGVLIILLGIFKLGRLISAIPWPVIE
ncbi:MAG: sodium-independent anion transporter, partial [Actinobacteria bacterium]|nr:sodium-independent anion transporter [Actinomycetota bacterium]